MAFKTFKIKQANNLAVLRANVPFTQHLNKMAQGK